MGTGGVPWGWVGQEDEFPNSRFRFCDGPWGRSQDGRSPGSRPEGEEDHPEGQWGRNSPRPTEGSLSGTRLVTDRTRTTPRRHDPG